MNFDAQAYARQLVEYFGADAVSEALSGDTDYSMYRENPAGFVKEVMGITLTDDIIRLAESVRDNRITVARSATGTGKSHGASAISIWFYKCFPHSRVYTVANPYENQKILWGELLSMAEGADLFAGEKITSMHIERSAKDFITALTVPTTGTDEVREGKFSGKHHEHMLFVCDEGDTIPDFAYRGIEGCMSGGHVRLLILFNPRYQAGTPYRHEYDRTASIIHLSAFRHPNVVTGTDVIPGAVNRETTVQRINEWCRPLAPSEKQSTNTFKLPSFLEGATARKKGTSETYPPLQAGYYFVNEPAFFYMVLGQYSPQAANQLISRGWVNTARSRWDSYVSRHGEVPPVGTRAVLGLDVGEFGPDVNCLIARYGGYVERPVIWSGIDVGATGDRAADEHQARNALRTAVDATGVGAGVAPHMQRLGCSAVPVKVASSPTEKTELGEFQILRDQLWWACREWLRKDPGAMLPPDEMLIEELQTPTYEVANGKVRVMRKDVMRELLRRSPDRADALCLTFAPSGFFGSLDLS